MAKIARFEFVGNTLLFWFLCMTGIGIPLAVIYLLSTTIRIEEEIDNPMEFLDQFRAGKFRK